MFKTDGNPFWIVKNASEVMLNLPKNISNIFTADITRCYENIPLTREFGLMNILEKICEWDFKKKEKEGYMKISLAKKTPKWVKKSCIRIPLSFDYFDLERIMRWLFNNNIVQVGEKCFRQMDGIPMGFACSPIMRNLYFAYFEYKYYTSRMSTGMVALLSWVWFLFLET